MLLKARQLEDQQNEQVVQIQRQGETLIVTLLLLMGFAIVALLWLLGRRVTRVIDELATGMTMVTAGYRDRKVTASEEDELGALARSFNEMTDRLNVAEVSLKEKITSLSQRTTQLEATNADLESFSYSVSHDLRAPLRAIDGYCAIIAKDYADQLDDEGRRLFGIVRENAMRMGQLIEDILAFSRAGRRELKAATLDMDTLAQEVWRGLEPQRTGRNVEFRCTGLPATFGDPGAIRQALQNLLSNALKFSGGRDPAVIEVAGRREKAENVYCVRDNGVGFDMAYVDKLFVLFQRLHGMVEFEGTGVGLAIVKRVIAKHGGRVWAQGKLGEGATFWFTLPAVQAGDQGKETASGSP
jgi:light-regulated signal transduction histidine kinase (bacteriophytochrome)